MRLYRNLSIRLKMMASTALVLWILVVMSLVIYAGLRVSQERERQLGRAAETLRAIDEISLDLATMELSYRTFLVSGDAQDLGRYATGYDSYLARQLALGEMLRGAPAQISRLVQVNSYVESWRSDVLDAGVRLRRALDDQSIDAVGRIDESVSDGRPTFESIRQLLEEMRAGEAALNEDRLAAAAAAAADLRSTLLLGTALAAASCLAALLLLGTDITRRVRQVAQAAADMTAGDLRARGRLPDSGDEIGRMAIAFNRMAETIQQRSSELEAQYATADSARREAELAREEFASQLAVIEAQREVIREMSIPVLPLSSGALVIPLVGVLDEERLALMRDRALEATERMRARWVILDITGVPLVDERLARELVRLMQAARLLGARVLIVGVRPEVAQAVVATGLDLSVVRTYRSLQDGVSAVLAAGT